MSELKKSRKGMGGRKVGAISLLAREYGISRNSLKRLGPERLHAMSEEARDLLIGLARENKRKALDGIDEPGTLKKRRLKLPPSERAELSQRRLPAGALVAKMMTAAEKGRVA